MPNKTVNKSTSTVYDFYTSKLADPTTLKNKNVCLLATGNAKYIDECRRYAKSALVLESCKCSPFVGADFKNIDSLKETIENWLKMNDMNMFDLIVMNPPYDGTLHLKILETVVPFAKKTVNVSPARWLTDPLSKYKSNSDLNKYRRSVAEHIAEIGLFDGDAIFGVAKAQAAVSVLDYGVIFNKHQSVNTCPSFIDKIVGQCARRLQGRDERLHRDNQFAFGATAQDGFLTNTVCSANPERLTRTWTSFSILKNNVETASSS